MQMSYSVTNKSGALMITAQYIKCSTLFELKQGFLLLLLICVIVCATIDLRNGT